MRRESGTYALILFSSSSAAIEVGRLGRCELRPGFYVYVGSALGPGGLRARIAHHQRVSQRPRWHIDYLRARTRLERVWYSYGTLRREHQWARAMRNAPGASMPLPRFGSSDCNCEAHLYFFESRPVRSRFEGSLRALDAGHPRVQVQVLR